MKKIKSLFNVTYSVVLRESFRLRIRCIFGIKSDVEKALNFVSQKMNRQNGFVRDNGCDYYVHPIHVAQILLNVGYRDSNLITAALLHDAIEDIEGIKFYHLEKQFNRETAVTVGLLTKEHGKDYKNIKNRSRYYYKISKSYKASLIKFADRIHNLKTLKHRTKEYKLRKIMQSKEIYFPIMHKWENIDFEKKKICLKFSKNLIKQLKILRKNFIKKIFIKF